MSCTESTPGWRGAAGFLEERARLAPGRVALVHAGREIGFAELDREAGRVARVLCDSGVAPGDRVVLCAPNSDRWVAALFGVFKAGAVAVPVHPDTPTVGLASLVNDCGATAAVTDPAVDAVRRRALAAHGAELLLLRDAWPPLDRARYTGEPERVQLPFAITGGDLASLLYTSGSSRHPRGVMCSHGQVRFAAASIQRVLDYRIDDVVLCGLPLSFDYGLYQLFLAFAVGARVVLERDLSMPMSLPGLLRRHAVTVFPAVPSVLALLLRSGTLDRVDLPALRMMTSTGEVLPGEHVARLTERFPHARVVPMYGLTECKRVSIMPGPPHAGRGGSVGLPIPGTHVEVVDEAGCPLGPGEVGELVVHGPHVASGYWNAPEETEERFPPEPGGGRCLRTGDYFSRDADGFLYFQARGEMVIKSLGERVGPPEVEAVLAAVPGVVESAVVGLPDPLRGESICAFVVQASLGTPTREAVLRACAGGLRTAAHPLHLVFQTEQLPRTGNGKIDRRALRSRAVAELLPLVVRP